MCRENVLHAIAMDRRSRCPYPTGRMDSYSSDEGRRDGSPIHSCGDCRRCGYNLAGLTEPRCRECGEPFEARGDATGVSGTFVECGRQTDERIGQLVKVDEG